MTMLKTNPILRHSRLALAAAGALVGAMAIPAGHAAAQSNYQAQITTAPLAAPAYAAPAYQAPAYAAPAYAAPAYAQPTYAAPAYQPPAYQTPAYQAPVAYAPPAGYVAQPAYPAPQPVYQATNEQITIYAPGVERHTIGRSDSGIPIEEITASRAVDISDLDLSRQQDVDTMDYRVRMAAMRACGTLENEYPKSLYPSYQSDNDNCVVRATNEGVEQERAAVARAQAIAYSQAAYYPR